MVYLRPNGEIEGGEDGVVLKNVPPEMRLKDDVEALFRNPSYCRVQVPLVNKWALRKSALVLEELAIRLRQIASNPEHSSNRALFYAHMAVKLANTDLQETTKSGKTEGN